MESNTVFHVLKRIDSQYGYSPILVLCDSWHKYDSFGIEILRRFKEESCTRVKIVDFFDIFDQTPGRQDLEDIDDRVLVAMQRHDAIEHIATLLDSDIFFNPLERFPYYGNFSREEKLFYFLKVLLRIESLVSEFKVEFMWAIERNYLVKNVASVVAQSNHIPYYCLAHSRIDDLNWVTDYCFPRSFPASRSNSNNFTDNSNVYSKFSRFYNELVARFQDEGYLYRSASCDIPSLRSPSFLKFGLRGYVSSIASVLRYYKFGPKYSRHYARSIGVLMFIYFTRTFFNKVFLFVIRFFIDEPHPSSLGRFLYLPLHYRPESSVLTLNSQTYDEDVILYVSRRLPCDVKLVVREHPLMFGERRFGFYKRVMSHSNVVLVFDQHPSGLYIKNSLAVVGISGTALLEASLSGKPTHAFGNPEFIETLSSSGFDSFPLFVRAIFSGRTNPNRNKIRNYLHEIFINSFKGRLDWSNAFSEKFLSEFSHNASSALMNRHVRSGRRLEV